MKTRNGKVLPAILGIGVPIMVSELEFSEPVVLIRTIEIKNAVSSAVLTVGPIWMDASSFAYIKNHTFWAGLERWKKIRLRSFNSIALDLKTSWLKPFHKQHLPSNDRIWHNWHQMETSRTHYVSHTSDPLIVLVLSKDRKLRSYFGWKVSEMWITELRTRCTVDVVWVFAHSDLIRKDETVIAHPLHQFSILETIVVAITLLAVSDWVSHVPRFAFLGRISNGTWNQR